MPTTARVVRVVLQEDAHAVGLAVVNATTAGEPVAAIRAELAEHGAREVRLCCVTSKPTGGGRHSFGDATVAIFTPNSLDEAVDWLTSGIHPARQR
ncbi:MAG: hypothetical protein GEU98_29075 [Pseudonocardiaceae bacterium]|nr:hypothetical protein [Pseudonocardiaceae bacterium]